MSVIIRLENLPWEARSIDIRRFFQGLQIPDGTLLDSTKFLSLLVHYF
jgi:hypothetical protein